MTAVISRRDGKSAYLTGVIGRLLGCALAWARRGTIPATEAGMIAKWLAGKVGRKGDKTYRVRILRT